MTIGDAVVRRIFQLCDSRNITINHLSLISGITQSTLSNVVSGRRKNPTISTIQKICDGLDISIQEFFTSPLFQDLEQELR